MANTCQYENCNAGATQRSGYRFCWWHDPDVDPDEKQRARSRGGVSSRPVKAWAIPEELAPVETILDLRRLYNSALAWLVSGTITPSQATAVRTLGGGLERVFELQMYAQLIEQRAALLDRAQEMGISVEPDTEEVWPPRLEG